MRITLIIPSDAIFVTDVSEDLDLRTLKVSCENESGLLADNMVIKYQGVILIDDSKSLRSYGICEDDVITIESSGNKHSTTSVGNSPLAKKNKPSTSADNQSSNDAVESLDFSGIVIPRSVWETSLSGNSKLNDPVRLRELVMSNTQQLELLKQNNPALANAAIAGDIESFKSILNSQLKERQRRLEEHKRLLAADPLNPETQQLIAESIRKENIHANMEAAMEYIPESFGLVVMLYINCIVNGVPVKAFIDSGAQATLMSVECAKKCNIMRLVDSRWTGIAKGVGEQKIIGRVHMATIVIENDHLTSSFSVLEQSVDMLLGLDMLRRHQCCIDLKNNVLRIGTTGTETRFLAEAELPDWAKLSNVSEQKSAVGADSAKAMSAASADDFSNPGPSNIFPDETVVELINYGFSRAEVLQELRNATGDKTKALAALFLKHRSP